MSTLILLNKDHVGHGDADLCARILKTFLQKANALGDLEGLAFMTSGVKLVSADSSVLAELTLLDEHGVDLYPCGTCLDFYGIEPAVGKVCSMDDIIAAMREADKVITL